MRFLEGPELVMRFINLYSEPPLKIASIQVPPVLIVAFVYVSLVLTLIPCFYTCYINVNDFLSLLPALIVISAVLSITASYTFLLSNRSFIIESLNQMDGYVQESKLDEEE